jgi:ankyrin repeat protein
MEWSAPTSAIFIPKNKKIQSGIEADAVKYNSIVNDEKFELYRAIIEGRCEHFEELTNKFTIESLNSVDSQGYTLLEWGTAFSSFNWPIDEELKEKGAEIPSDKEGLNIFRRNVFFIGLQYLPPNKAVNSKLIQNLCFDWIDIRGVNRTDDTALHLALYGEKWEIAEKILPEFEDYHVNTTNIRGDTPLHLAAKLKHCEIGLFNKILHRTNSENVNKADGNGCTALHWAARANSTEKMQLLLDGGIDINAQDNEGNTALHIAIMKELKTAKKFIKHEKVDVNVPNNDNRTALHLACKCWPNISAHTFKNILEKSTNINAQDKDGNTALHYAISEKSETALQELLKHKDVNVNVKNNFKSTVLHYASRRQNLAVELFKLILEKSTDVNAQNEKGDTALHCGILNESKIAVERLLSPERRSRGQSSEE